MRYWEVCCTPPGQKRYKKKHPSPLEAEHDKARLLRTVATGVTKVELDEASAAILRLKNSSNPETKGKNILDAVDFFLEKYIDPNKFLSVPDYANEFLERKRKENLRAPTISELEKFINEFANHFRGNSIRDIATAEVIEHYLYKHHKFNKNRCTNLNQFFNYLAGTAQTTNRYKKVIEQNPIRAIPKARKDATDISEIQITDAAETAAVLKKAAEFNAQRLFVWLYFTGMRPTETVKFWNASNPWSKINLLAGVITVNGSISKTRDNRQIRIQPNLKLWLEKYAGVNFMTKNWRDKYGWTKKILPESKREVTDIARHTFISYLTRITKSGWQDVELQAGNTKHIQMSHYLALVHDDPEDFWNITPDSIGVFDMTEEEYARQGYENRRRAILENKKKIKLKKNGTPL